MVTKACEARSRALTMFTMLVTFTSAWSCLVLWRCTLLSTQLSTDEPVSVLGGGGGSGRSCGRVEGTRYCQSDIATTHLSPRITLTSISSPYLIPRESSPLFHLPATTSNHPTREVKTFQSIGFDFWILNEITEFSGTRGYLPQPEEISYYKATEKVGTGGKVSKCNGYCISLVWCDINELIQFFYLLTILPVFTKNSILWKITSTTTNDHWL